MNQNDYIRMSLELHLFFARIMKEHSFFLATAFTERDQSLKSSAQNFQTAFANLLSQTIQLADGNMNPSFLSSNEMVTKDTLSAEMKTSALSGIFINTNITQKEIALRSGSITPSNAFLSQVANLNRQALPLISNFIQFKSDILEKVTSCNMYTTNYPLLITHILNEAKMYYTLLSKLENGNGFTASEIYEQEIFWNTIMKEHAEFIRGLLDPIEKELIITADRYAGEYEQILTSYQNNPSALTRTSLNETLRFRDFKVTGEEGILNCKIKSIIIPLLADHVVREANHFIRILRGFTRS